MKSLEALLKVFAELHPEDAARALESVDAGDAVRLLAGLPPKVAAGVIERTSGDAADRLLVALDDPTVSAIVEQMTPRAGAIVLHHLPAERRDGVLGALPEAVARPLRDTAGYPADTVGGIMDTRVASLPIDLTVQQVIGRIRKIPRETLHYLYVTDRDRRIIGVLTMRDLLLSGTRDPIEPMVKRNVVSVPATMSCEELIDMMRAKRFVALPVVDFDGRLIGVVKRDEVMAAGELEAFEDMQKIVGAGADERALSPVSTVVRSRLPWLMVNLGTAFMAAAVVGLFEGVIAQVAALAVMLPIVAGQGGNTGAQSLAVVMRGLALREIIPGVNRRVVSKELVAGVINGVAVAVVTSLAVLAWRAIVGDAASVASGLALVIGLAMIVNMAAAALSGAAIPLVLHKMGRDPAQSASIFLTTVTDIVGFAAFLGFAKIMMPMITTSA
ncbi:MAG: magnesium transporter [Phycisphaera sp.]|nr:magnesium transporter [Phycisphaera sp.]